MSKKLLTAEVVETLATLAVNGRLDTLTVSKYKSGKNKGKYYADFTEGERTVDVKFIQTLQSLARGMKSGVEYEIDIYMPLHQHPSVRVIQTVGELNG